MRWPGQRVADCEEYFEYHKKRVTELLRARPQEPGKCPTNHETSWVPMRGLLSVVPTSWLNFWHKSADDEPLIKFCPDCGENLSAPSAPLGDPKPPMMELRPDDAGDLDDIVIEDVTMFRAERMDKNAWWVCCYFDNGPKHDRITFWFRASKKNGLMMTLTEEPESRTITTGKSAQLLESLRPLSDEPREKENQTGAAPSVGPDQGETK